MSATRSSRRLIVIWLFLAALAAVIVTIERRDQAASNAPVEDARGERMLLPVAIEQLGAIEIVQKGTLHRFERDATGPWFYHGVHTGVEREHGHGGDPAAAARIEKAFAGLGRARMERQFPLNTAADEFGVTRPDILIMAYRPGDVQPLSRYAVGIVAPDGVSRYVLPVGSSQVVTIPNYQIDNLLSLIAEFSRNPGQAKTTQNPS